MVYMGRLVASFEPTDTITVVLGGSALFGPNATGISNRTQIYGGDLKIKWKSRWHHQGFPFVS